MQIRAGLNCWEQMHCLNEFILYISAIIKRGRNLNCLQIPFVVIQLGASMSPKVSHVQIDQINSKNHQEVSRFHSTLYEAPRGDVQSRSVVGPDPESCALLAGPPRTLARVLFSSPAASSAFFWKSLSRAKTPLFQRAATSAASSRRPSTAPTA